LALKNKIDSAYFEEYLWLFSRKNE